MNTVCFLLGIFIAQENPDIPNIKECTKKFLRHVKTD